MQLLLLASIRPHLIFLLCLPLSLAGQTFVLDEQIQKDLTIDILEQKITPDTCELIVRVNNPTRWAIREYNLGVWLSEDEYTTEEEMLQLTTQKKMEFYQLSQTSALSRKGKEILRLTFNRKGAEMMVNQIEIRVRSVYSNREFRTLLRTAPDNEINALITADEVSHYEITEDGKPKETVHPGDRNFNLDFIRVTSMINLNDPEKRYLSISFKETSYPNIIEIKEHVAGDRDVYIGNQVDRFGESINGTGTTEIHIEKSQITFLTQRTSFEGSKATRIAYFLLPEYEK